LTGFATDIKRVYTLLKRCSPAISYQALKAFETRFRTPVIPPQKRRSYAAADARRRTRGFPRCPDTPSGQIPNRKLKNQPPVFLFALPVFAVQPGPANDGFA
jgi:hypothetical protein